MRTIIHNKNITNKQKEEFHTKIQKWFEDISKVKYCKELIDVITQCDDLKIIFDFESELVHNTELYGSTTSVSPYKGRTIIIDAKLSSTKTDQDIKGDLAREFCLLAFSLTFETTSHPYHKHDVTADQQLSQIIQTISNWTSEDTDKSSEIISSVIKSATPENIKMELLATAVQILVQFDDDKEELTRFEVKFKELFDYLENLVLPEMKNLNLKLRENVRKFNRIAGGILPCLGLELSELKDVKSLTENNLSIIQTNLPKLLLIDIQKSSYKNIFVSAEKLQSCQELLHNLLTQDSTLNVFVTFADAGKIDENLKNIFTSTKFTFIVSDDVQCQELAQKLAELGLSPTKVEVNYGWNDLTVDSQKLLLKMKINFQNNSEFSFLDILKDEFYPEVARNFGDVVDDQLLSLMIEGSEVAIYSQQESKYLADKTILKDRNFIKQEQIKYNRKQFPDNCLPTSKTKVMSQDEMLQECKNAKFVILSDKLGSGKTLAMKFFSKILRQQNPTKWVTFVDLKQFSEQIKDQLDTRSKVKFLEFYAEIILKHKSQFEVKIFKKMYDLGKVLIFFDGLDELAPRCTDFILKVIKTFELNKQNQLWISTCKPLGVELEKILEVDVKYKFEELKDEDCVDWIVGEWMHSGGSEGKSGVDPDNLSSYKNLAKDLLIENSSLKLGAIGMPQLCKMIAEITKVDKISTTELKELTIFRDFIQKLYKNWSNLQELKIDGCKLSFWTFHEFLAMKSSFSNYSDLCDFNIKELKVWTDKDIITAGLMAKNGQNFDFLHASCRDFLIAELILKKLQQEEVSNRFIEFLWEILTGPRNQYIRMFLSQGTKDLSEVTISDKTIKSITANIKESTNISYIFLEGLDDLQKFLVICLNKHEYNFTKSIIDSNIDAVFAATKISEVPINLLIFLDFLVKFYHPKCLENLIKQKILFLTIIESCEDIEYFGVFINAVEKKISTDFVVRILKSQFKFMQPNIFFTFCWSKKIDSQKIQKFLKILNGFLSVNRTMKLLENKSKRSYRSVIYSFIEREDPKVFRVLWTEIENFYKSNNCLQKFKELVTYRASTFDGAHGAVARSNNIKLHEVFWELALETLGREELKKFINLEIKSYLDWFLTIQMSVSDSIQIIEFTLEKLQEIFGSEEFFGIIEGCNVLFKATELSNKIEIFEALWKFMRKLCKTDEKFMSLACKRNEQECSILAAALWNYPIEKFCYLIQELKKILKPQEINLMLTNIDNNCQNILYNVLDKKLFLTIWNLLFEYLIPSEILEIIKNPDVSGNNFISNLYLHPSSNIDIIQDVWTAIKTFIKEHEVLSEEITENIEKCDKFINKWNESRKQNKNLDEVIKLRWLSTKDLRLLDFPESLRIQISQSELFSCAYDFHVLSNCDNFEIHKICWQFIIKKYENLEDLVNLMIRRSVNGSSSIHRLMSNKNTEVINFTLKNIEDNFNEAQIRKILTVKCSKGYNLLSVAVHDTKDLQIIYILWTMHQKCFSLSDLIDFISQNNSTSSSILFHTAGSCSKTFIYLWAEVETQLSIEGTRNLADLVSQRNQNCQNIFHVCVEQHDIELLQIVWNKVTNVLGGSLKSVFKLIDIHNDDSYDWYNDVLNILDAATKSDEIEFHEALWELLWGAFKEPNELRSLILWRIDEQTGKAKEKVEDDDDSSCDDQDVLQSGYGCYAREIDEPLEYKEYKNKTSILYYLKDLFQVTNLDVIRLTMINLDKILSKNEICGILTSDKPYCFLENKSENIGKHKLLWDIFLKYLTVPDLKDSVYKFFNRIICNSATISIEVFNFTWHQVIKHDESVLIPSLEDDNHIIRACLKLEDTEFLKIVWTKVENFYIVQNLPEGFKKFVLKQKFYDSILEAASKIDNLEIHEVLWELLLSVFENREELKDILVKREEYFVSLIGDCFRNKDIKVVEFLIKVFQENFTDNQLQELMSADIKTLLNCLKFQIDFEVFKIWWKFLRVIFNNSKKFTKFIEANDNFDTIFICGCDKVHELLLDDLESLKTHEEIRKYIFEASEV